MKIFDLLKTNDSPESVSIHCTVSKNKSLFQVEGEIVLANKEQHILACTVTVLPDLKVTSETFVEGENILHGTGEVSTAKRLVGIDG